MYFARIIFVINISFALFSCNGNPMLESNRQKLDSKSSDTIITFSLDDFSSEGTEAIAKYQNNKIKTCLINVYGETGKKEILYTFNNDIVLVVSKEFSYDGQIENISNDSQVSLKSKSSYKMNRNGIVLDSKEEDYIFIYIKSHIPFVLKDR